MAIDAWEQRKLREVSERVTRKNSKIESTLPLTISAQYGLIDQNTFFSKQIASQDVSKYLLIKKGEFAYNKSYSTGYPWGAIKRLDRYLQGVLSTLYIVFSPTNINSDFLTSYFDSNVWYKEVSKNAAEGARNHGLLNISPMDFFDISLTVPVKESEQSLISQYFFRLQKIIVLHERKLELLKRLKEAYLQQLLPKKGLKEPEFRFPEFTGEWKQHKANSIFKSVSEKNHGDLPILSASQKGGMVLRDNIGIDIKFDASSVSGYKLVRPGQFVIHLRSFQGGFAYSSFLGITSPAYTVLDFVSRDNQCPFFWKEVLRSQAFIQRLSTVTYGIRDGRSISFNDFGTLLFCIPPVKEQLLISKFLQELNAKIKLNSRKLAKLRELKQAYLQKMFI